MNYLINWVELEMNVRKECNVKFRIIINLCWRVKNVIGEISPIRCIVKLERLDPYPKSERIILSTS
jgi:hypothetical protein